MGKRNYKGFFTFIVLTSLLAWIVVAQIIIVFARGSWREDGVGYLVVNIILMVYDTLFGLFILSLLVIHFYLAGSNTTTYEMCKDHWKILSGNPFRKSCFMRNYIKMFVTGTGNPVIADPFEPVEQRAVVQTYTQGTDTNIFVKPTDHLM